MTMLTVSPASHAYAVDSHLVSRSLTTGAQPSMADRGPIDIAAESVIRSASQNFNVNPRCQRLAAEILARLWAASVPGQRGRPGELALTPQTFPLPAGGIQLEWHAGDDHIEIAVEWDGTIGVYAKVGSEERDWEPTADEDLPFFVGNALSGISDSVWTAGVRN